jgi:hypothetical protein
MNEYSGVKKALRQFIIDKLGISGNQVFRYPVKPTEVGTYPIFVIRSAQTSKVSSDETGRTENQHRIVVGIMTRGNSMETISDELDSLLQSFDNAIVTYGVGGLDRTLASDSRWLEFTRIGENTEFDNAVEDEQGWVVFGATAGVRIREALPTTGG